MIGVLAGALLATAAAALLTHGRAADVAEAASPLPPTPAGTLLARMRIVLPTLVLSDSEARALDFRIRSNTFDNRYPPEPAATFRWPLPGQTPNSPMMSEFFAGGFVLGKAENLEGRSRPGNVAVVVWAFKAPEGAFRSLRALRDLSGLHSAPSSFAPGAVLLSLPGTGVSDLVWVRGRALIRASSGVAQGGKSMLRARERVARAIDAKIAAEPYVGGAPAGQASAPRPHDAGGAPRLAAHRRERSPGRARHPIVAGAGAARRARAPVRRPGRRPAPRSATARSACAGARGRWSPSRRSTAST